MLAGAACIVLAGCAVAPRSEDKRILLAYAGEPGRVSRYSAEQTLRGRISAQGMPQLMVVKTRFDVMESVKEILDYGRRRVTMEYGIASLEVNGAELDIDGKWKRLRAEFLRAPNGTIEEEEAESSQEMLKWVTRGLETFFPVFPEKPVRVGERWERGKRTGQEDGGMETKISVVFSGVEETEGISCAVLKLEGSARGEGFSLGEGSGRLELEYSGVAYFDIVSGRLLRARQKGSLRMETKSEGISADARLIFIAQIRLITDP